MDCILTYHLNPLTCGIARFNTALGQQLTLPVHHVFSDAALAAKRPLLSIRTSEMSESAIARLDSVSTIWPKLALFLHDYTGTDVERKLVRRAERIYCANKVISNDLKTFGTKVVSAWCPGFLFEHREFEFDAEITIYTFGMAHKLRTDYFSLLHSLLEKANKRYIIYISAAIHEDTTLDESFTEAYEQLRRIFGDRVFFVGFVSDAALHAFLRRCTFFAAFFKHGVRANNTSVSTAMQCGAVVLTNLDEGSPSQFRHMKNVVDIHQCADGLPLDRLLLSQIAAAGAQASSSLGWEPLVELLLREESAAGDPRTEFTAK